MAQAQISLFSHALGMSTVATVCMPEHLEEGKAYPALWLLPGEGGDGSEWSRYTCLEAYAEEYGFIALSPCTQLSLYTDMFYGNTGRFFTYVTEEFPQLMGWTFPLDLSRQYVAGFSMGGYGAFKWAAQDPGRFLAVGTFGGVHDMVEVAKDHIHDGVLDREFFLAFDSIDRIAGSSNDALWLASEQIKSGNMLPQLFISVGDGDPLRGHNEQALTKLQALGCRTTWDVAPGNHSYLFCESRLRAFLDWSGIGKGSIGGKEAEA